MNFQFLIKGSILGLIAALCTSHVSAQKIADQELKTNVTTISGAIHYVKQLEPIKFNYDVQKFKNLKLPSSTQYGFTSNSVGSAFPSILQETSQMYPAGKNSLRIAKYDDINKDNLIPVLVAAIQEQQIEIENLRKEITRLKEVAK
jgi:hypothetical protein